MAVTKQTWAQSVPPAVAGGYVVDTLGSKGCACTHPLPQVVLTVSKNESLKPQAIER
jgi:hypothetical protein